MKKNNPHRNNAKGRKKGTLREGGRTAFRLGNGGGERGGGGWENLNLEYLRPGRKEGSGRKNTKEGELGSYLPGRKKGFHPKAENRFQPWVKKIKLKKEKKEKGKGKSWEVETSSARMSKHLLRGVNEERKRETPTP